MSREVDPDYLPDARQVSSPNCDERPAGSAVELLVIHSISLPPGEFGGDGIDRLFTNCLEPEAHPYYREIADVRVSSHLLVRRDGNLVQYVPFSKRAWHAGDSCFQGREACNDFSIGIELEGHDNTPYTDDQYACLARVVNTLQAQFPALTQAAIVGHSDISPGRKTDPGPTFDWTYFRQQLDQQDA